MVRATLVLPASEMPFESAEPRWRPTSSPDPFLEPRVPQLIVVSIP